MNYYKLPVYNATRIFYKDIRIHTNKTDRDERYAFVIPVMREVSKIMKNLSFLNSSDEKIPYIDANIDIMRQIQIDIRN